MTVVVNVDDDGDGGFGETVEEDLIPETLRECEQWVCWREEVREGEDKPTKVPVDPETGTFASTTDSETWTDFETARVYADEEADGIGFVFSEDDEFVGVDLDDCRDPQTETTGDLARDIIERLDSYTEISPSGAGFHVIVRGSLPGGRNRRGNVEMYETTRFFTVTGNHVPETPPEVHDRSEELTSVYHEFVHDPSEIPEDGATAELPDVESADDTTASDDRTDAEVLEQARNAANGEKFERLWNGSTAGYESHSEADMALCCLLAFWTQGDATRMDALFRDSGLMRPKWDEVHYADGSTYGSKTIQRAIARTSEFYDPEANTEPSTSGGTVGDGSSTAPAGSENAVQNARTTSVYLEEQNRLLRQRVREQEATIEQQADHIEELEVVIDELQAVLADRDARIEELHDSLDSTRSGVWSRVRQRFADQDEG